MPPPDENTAVDPTGTAWVVWLVIVGPGVLFATLMCVRRVAPGELVLVVRHDTVIRSRRYGLLLRVPVLQHFETVPAAPRVLPLVVRSTTADGVDVIALADLELEVREVRPGDPNVSTAEVVRIAESTLGAVIEGLDVRSLVDDLPELEAAWADLVGRQLPPGTEVTALAVTEVEARLTPGGPA